MPPRDRVSVIVPTYNRASLLPAALESVLGQSHPDVEVIVIDDGSTDDTKTVVEPFMDRVQYLETENGGPAHARNIGMRAATGRYLAFLDSDDLYLPGKLELQAEFMDTFPEVGLVSTEVSAFDAHGVLEEYHLRSYHGIWQWKNLSYDQVYDESGSFTWSGRDEPVPYYIGDVFPYMLMGTLISENTVFFRREVLEKVGFQNESYRYGQGYDWLVRASKNFRAGFLNLPTYQLRYHDGQHSLCQVPVGRKRERKPEIDEKRRAINREVWGYKLGTILEWGYKDAEFYAAHRELVDRRLAEIYHAIGRGWLSIGEKEKGRESFRAGMKHDHTWGLNRRWHLWSFLPGRMWPLIQLVEWKWKTFRER
jgi:glycosyltransferase involved in cell wall biosynthesis